MNKRFFILSMTIGMSCASNIEHAASRGIMSLEQSLYLPLKFYIKEGDLEGMRQYRETFLSFGSFDWKDSDGHTLSWHADKSKNAEIIKLLAAWKTDQENPNNKHIDSKDVRF